MRNFRPRLNVLLRKFKPGNTLLVWQLDRLGRSLRYLVDTIDHLGKKNMHFVSLTGYIDTPSWGGFLLFHMRSSKAHSSESVSRLSGQP